MRRTGNSWVLPVIARAAWGGGGMTKREASALMGYLLTEVKRLGAGRTWPPPQGAELDGKGSERQRKFGVGTLATAQFAVIWSKSHQFCSVPSLRSQASAWATMVSR